MPYPNSQTPVTMKLNEIFRERATYMPLLLERLIQRTNPANSMANLAITYGVVQGTNGRKHIQAWPTSQQDTVRDTMIYALESGLTISFDWQTDTTTSAEVVYFGDSIGVTLRSPLNYPPYWGGS